MNAIVTAEDIAIRLGAERTSRGWKTACPCHNGKGKNSLNIAEDNGKLLLHCFAGCTYATLCDRLGIEKPMQDKDAWCIVATDKRMGCEHTGVWAYHNEIGRVVSYALRYDLGSEKEFRPVSYFDANDGKGLDWHRKAIPANRPLYRLPQLLTEDTVYIVEGEKCADALNAIGLSATTAYGGALAPKKTDWTPLTGKSVILIPDNDIAGESYIQAIQGLLVGITDKVKVVRLPGLLPKDDVVDFIKRHGNDKAKESIDSLTMAPELPRSSFNNATESTTDTTAKPTDTDQPEVKPNKRKTIADLYSNSKAEYTFDLSEFPETFKTLVYDFEHLASGRTTTAVGFALYAVSAICGKKVTIKVNKRAYKTQMRIADSDRSGSGKSPTLECLHTITSKYIPTAEYMNNCTMTSFFKSRAEIITRGKDDGPQVVLDKKKEVENLAKSNPFVSALVVDDGESFLSSMTNWKQPRKYLSEYCSLIDDAPVVSYETGKNDTMVIGDPCVPLFLNITVNAWKEFANDENVRSSGAAFRHLPINGCKLAFKVEPTDMPRQKVDEMLTNLTKMREVVVNDLPYENGVDNYESQAQENVLNEMPLFQELIDNDPETAKLLLPKASIAAKKIAAMLWCLENHKLLAAFNPVIPEPNARQYYRMAFKLVMTCYLTDLAWHSPSNTDSDDMDRIVAYVKKHPACLKSELNRKVRVTKPSNFTVAQRMGFLLRELQNDQRLTLDEKTSRYSLGRNG